MRVYLLTLIHIYTSLHLLQLTFILQINSDYWPDENKSLIVQLTKLMWHCKHIHFISKTYLCKPTYPYKCNGRLWNVVPNTEPWKRCKQIILYVLSITPKNFLNHLENLKIFCLYVTFITHKVSLLAKKFHVFHHYLKTTNILQISIKKQNYSIHFLQISVL